MIFELTGSLKELAFEYYEAYKEWQETVLAELNEKCIADTEIVSFIVNSTVFHSGTVTGVVCTESPGKTWKQIDTSLKIGAEYKAYKPNKRYKDGKYNDQVIFDLPHEPGITKIANALGFENAYFYVGGSRYATLPLHILGNKNRAFLTWYEDYPELNHPELTEVLHSDYRQIIQED